MIKNEAEILVQAIVEKRKSLKLTQNKLATKAGLSRSAIEKLERQKGLCSSLHTLLKVLNALEIRLQLLPD